MDYHSLSNNFLTEKIDCTFIHLVNPSNNDSKTTYHFSLPSNGQIRISTERFKPFWKKLYIFNEKEEFPAIYINVSK